jgi:putative hydrolase of the HAD superfamily
VFDIDDTMYPVTNGFTKHRTDIALSFMTDELGFASKEVAKAFRDEHFAIHHSMVKVLTVAAETGLLPPKSDGSPRAFDSDAFSHYYYSKCKFDQYLSPNAKFIEALTSLVKIDGLKVVIFTNGPRKYALRVLDAIGVTPYFSQEDIFAVEDVMPTPKPHVQSFQKVLESTGCLDPSHAVMFEDSMKNVKVAKSIGMKTVLIVPDIHLHDVGDVPLPDDPSVDVVLRDCGELSERIPSLWQKEWMI